MLCRVIFLTMPLMHLYSKWIFIYCIFLLVSIASSYKIFWKQQQICIFPKDCLSEIQHLHTNGIIFHIGSMFVFFVYLQVVVASLTFDQFPLSFISIFTSYFLCLFTSLFLSYKDPYCSPRKSTMTSSSQDL